MSAGVSFAQSVGIEGGGSFPLKKVDLINGTGVVAHGELRRRKEAMEQLVVEICKAEDDVDDHFDEEYSSMDTTETNDSSTIIRPLSSGVRIAICNHLRTAIERGYLKDFSSSLQDARKKKDAEIDRICSRHYSEFLSSSREILHMRGSAQAITEKVKEMISNFNSTGGSLSTVLSKLQEVQKEKENIHKLLEDCNACKEIASLMVKTRQQIESDEHYSAMRTIEIIKGEVGSLSVKAMTDFVQNWLPVAVNKLLYGAKQDADAFLQQRRRNLEAIGVTVLRKQAELSSNSSAADTLSDARNFRQFSATSSLPSAQRPYPSSSSAFSPSSLAAKSSISLKYIRLNSHVFSLERWSSPAEFDNLVPAHFRIPAHANPEGVDLLESLLHDMGPLHKVLHLYAVLGNLNSYHESYRSGRDAALKSMMQQADRAANANSQQGLSVVLPRYMDGLVGFFTVECAHRRSVEIADGAFSQQELSSLWEKACQHISQLCSTFSITASSPEELILIKEEILLLIDTVTDDAFGFKASALKDVMKDLWEVFQGQQIFSVSRSCSAALDSCAYQPFFVSSDEAFKHHIRAYRLDNIELNKEQSARPGESVKLLREKSSIAAANLDLLEEEMSLSLSLSVGPGTSGTAAFSTHDSLEEIDSYYGSDSSVKKPRPQSASAHIFMAQTFPFSEAVPQLMHELYVFVVRFFVFAVKNPHLGSRSQEICSAVVSAYEAIGKHLTAALQRDGSETPLSKACQISIDAATLSAAADSLWQLVEAALLQFRWTDKIDSVIASAMEKVGSCMQRVVTESQDLIFELLSNKISDLLSSLVFVNFEPEIMPSGPHESIESLIEFLQITLMWLTHLPVAVREAVHFTCCSKIASGILEHLLSSSKVPSLNVLCVLAFDLDVRKLVQFADSCGIPNLRQCFDEMGAVIKAILHPDLPQLADNIALRKQLFPRLNIEKLAILLEKMSPSSIVAFSNNLPRMEKALTRGLAKKLKSQAKSV